MRSALPLLLLASLLPPSLDLATRWEPPSRAGGGLVTLWAADDLAAAFGFGVDGPAAAITDGEVDLLRAQLVYHAFAPELVSFGFRDDELVAVVDLGAGKLPPRERAQEAALEYPVSFFHTLALDGGRFTYLDADGRELRLRAADDALGVLPSPGLRHFEPVVGHVYVVRWRPRSGRGADRIAKLQVVAVRPGESLTFRWAPVGER